MPAQMELRWLKESDYQGASQRFVKFCKDDITQQADNNPDFDLETYEASIRIILEKLSRSEDNKNQGVK